MVGISLVIGVVDRTRRKVKVEEGERIYICIKCLNVLVLLVHYGREISVLGVNVQFGVRDRLTRCLSAREIDDCMCNEEELEVENRRRERLYHPTPFMSCSRLELAISIRHPSSYPLSFWGALSLLFPSFLSLPFVPRGLFSTKKRGFLTNVEWKMQEDALLANT